VLRQEFPQLISWRECLRSYAASDWDCWVSLDTNEKKEKERKDNWELKKMLLSGARFRIRERIRDASALHADNKLTLWGGKKGLP